MAYLPYIGALVVSLLVIAAVPWLSIGSFRRAFRQALGMR